MILFDPQGIKIENIGSLDELSAKFHAYQSLFHAGQLGFILDNDTAMLYPTSRVVDITNQIINEQRYIHKADSTMQEQQSVISRMRLNEVDLKGVVKEKENIIGTIRKRWFKITLFSSAGTLVVGGIAGTIFGIIATK